jgi:hypothetical protein
MSEPARVNNLSAAQAYPQALDKAGKAYPQAQTFQLLRLLALPTSIRHGWKGLPGTNALAYYKKS